MNKAKRQQIIHEAADLVAIGEFEYSCNAIYGLEPYATPLTEKYGEFYGMADYWFWPSLGNKDGTAEERKQHRLMLLAWFAKVGLEGLA